MLQRLRRFVPQLMTAPVSEQEAQVHAPLLDEAELDQLIHRIASMAQAARPAQEVNYRHAGDDRSVYLGRGMDFEEVRQYQPGDEIRDMDWRTTARTGKPYLKVYREEHQPALHIVIDRGASMRFGTRRQLKVTQAARLAACFAFSAMRQNTRISGALWQPGGFVLPGLNGEAGAMRLVQAAIAACPPLPAEANPETGRFSDLLKSLDALLQRGTRIVLVSDFTQLHEPDLPLLMRLAEHHSLLAIQVTDPAEYALPDVGMMQFHDIRASAMRWLDTGRRSVRSAFHQRAEAMHAMRQLMFERIGTTLHVCSTDEDEFAFFLKVNRYE